MVISYLSLSFVYLYILYPASSVNICHYTCRNCIGNQQYQCLECNSEYWLHPRSTQNYGTCEPCTQNCASCLSATRCENCYKGFYLSQATGMCKQCQTGVAMCTLSAIQQCKTGYEQMNGECRACPDNCLTCSNQICSQCQLNYYISQNSCEKCQITNCAQCPSPLVSPTTCYQCEYGYTGQQCQSQCSSNCGICFQKTCYVCKDNFELINNQCQYLPLLCKSGTITQCKQCLESFSYKNTYGICIPYYSIQGTKTLQYITSSNNDNVFIQTIELGSIKNQDMHTFSCQNINFIHSGTSMFSWNLKTNPIFSFSLQMAIAVKAETIVLALSMHFVGQDSGIREVFTQRIIEISEQKKSSRQCSDNFIMLNTDIIEIPQISSTQPLYNSSSQSIMITISNGDDTIIAISQVLVTLSHCEIDNCEICELPYTCASCRYPLFLQNHQCIHQCSTGYYLTQQLRLCTVLCPQKYYPIFEDYLCKPCISPCSFCSNSSFCLSCESGSFLFEGSCLQKCPQAYYRNIELLTCERCLYPCYQCESGNKCLSCSIGYLQVKTKTCAFSCLQGTYLNFTLLSCQSCAPPCYECQSLNSCLSCLDGYFINGNQCVDECPTGSIEIQYNQSDDMGGICQQCSHPCKQCKNEPIYCIKCLVGYLLNNQCLTSCPISFYPSQQNQICQPCIYPCQSCQNAQKCRTCQQRDNLTLFFYRSKCYQQCPQSTFPNRQTNICEQCIQPCRTCVNSTYCLTCIQQFIFIYHEGKCYLECPPQTYASIDQSCRACKDGCAVCVGDGKNGSICQQCTKQYYLYQDGCVNQCSSTTYLKVYNIHTFNFSRIFGVCSICQFPCIQCQSLLICKRCDDEYYLTKDGKCVLQCEEGTFLDVQNGDKTCQQCHNYCKQCESSSFCSSCKHSYFLHEGNCQQFCPVYFFPSYSTQSCQECLYPCRQCLSRLTCSTCINNQSSGEYLFLHQGYCLDQCPSGYIEVISDIPYCQKCSQNCLTCWKTRHSCVSCIYPLFLIQESCVSECPFGYYPHQTMLCYQCQAPCQSCTDSANYCTKCTGNLYLKKGTCYEQCNHGQYGSVNLNQIRVCQLCQFPCKQCSSIANNCTSCYGSDLYLTKQEGSTNIYFCSSQCPSTMYPNKLLRKCSTCLPSCKTCIQEHVCLSCNPNKYLINNQCLEECPQRYYESTTNKDECLACENPCYTCQSQSICTSCIERYFHYNETCLEQCPQTYYPIISGNNRQCNKCPAFCHQCYDFSACKSCVLNSSRPYLQKKNCVSKCSQGYYPNSQENLCLSCSSNCLICESETLCKKCSGSYLWEGRCLQSCPYQTFGDLAGECLSCRQPCKQCFDVNNCKNCAPNYFLYLQFCLRNCPTNQWAYPMIQQCHDYCNLFKDYENKYCLENCPLYYTEEYQCVNQCPEQHIINGSLGCFNCQNQDCSQVPYYKVEFINSGNQILMAMIFSQPLDNIDEFVKQDSTYSIQQKQINYLQSSNNQQGNNKKIPNKIQIINSNLLFLEIQVNKQSTIKHELNSLKKLTYLSYPLQNRTAQCETGSINLSMVQQPIYFMYLGRLIGSFFILLLGVNLVFDNCRALFMPFQILQEVALLVYLDIWFHPSLQELFNGLSLMNFKGLPIYFQFVSHLTYYWDCSIKRLYHDHGCNPISVLIEIGMFFIIFLVIGGISKLWLNRFRKNKHKICWNHLNNCYWIFGYPIFFYGISINQVSQVVFCIVFIFGSIVILYQVVKNIFKNTYGESTFFWQLKKSKCKNILGNTYYIMAMCRKSVIFLSIGFTPEKPIFPLSFATITTVLIIVNIVWNKPYKKYGIFITMIQILYCIFIFLMQLIIVASKQFEKAAWESISIIAFVVMGVVIGLIILIVMKDTIAIIQRNIKKIKNEKNEKHQGSQSSKQTSQVSSTSNCPANESQNSPIQKQTPKHGSRASRKASRQASRQGNSIIEQSKQYQSSISSIISKKQGTAAPYLLKIDKLEQ